MKITRFTPQEPMPFRPLDSFSLLRIDEPESLNAVLELVEQERRSDPAARYLITLDDINQCYYTSGHARENSVIDYYEIYHKERGDYNDDDSAVVVEFEQAQLRHVAQCLDDPALRQDWRDVAKVMAAPPDGVTTLVMMNRDPDHVLDTAVYVQKLPVARDDLLIAGLPNGYFTCDWRVFENHAAIRLLGTHNYRFFGIGAGWLGFIRDGGMSQMLADKLIADLAVLYGQPEPATAWMELAQVVQVSPYLLLAYADYAFDFE
jgi:hypothetical protein